MNLSACSYSSIHLLLYAYTIFTIACLLQLEGALLVLLAVLTIRTITDCLIKKLEVGRKDI